MSGRAPKLPARFSLGSQLGRMSAGGVLVIEPGAVCFEPSSIDVAQGKPEAIHAVGPVTLRRARLLPAGLNAGLVLHAPEGTVCVYVWWGALRPVRRALAAAGVPVIEQRTWVGVGWYEGLNGWPPWPS